MNKTRRLIVDDREIELPVVTGTDGEPGTDISSLRAQTGYIALDPDPANTGSRTSSITFVDGEKGILHCRGYNIAGLCVKILEEEAAHQPVPNEGPRANP